MVLLNRGKVLMFHGLFGGDSLSMVIDKHLRQQFDGFIRAQLRVFIRDEFVPKFFRVAKF
jgi:hypothetical protein